MITSEVFYRAECDHEGCGETLPSEGDEASHWPRVSVVEALRDERGEYDETWAVVGDLTFCPRHAPGNADCTMCEYGVIRSEATPGGQFKYIYADCPVCDGRGYVRSAPVAVDGTREATGDE